MQRPNFKRLFIWATCLACLWLALPNAFHGRLAAPEAAWPSWLSSQTVSLGLDLQGGAHLLAEVDTDGVAARRMDDLWPELRDGLRAIHGETGGIRRLEAPADELRVRIANPAGMDAALAVAHDITGQAGPSAELEATADGARLSIRYTAAGRAALTQRVVAQSLEIVRRRIDETGTREPTILRQGEDRILVEVPGMGSAAELERLIGTTASLSFHQVLPAAAEDAMSLPSATEPGRNYRLDRRAVVSGTDLTDSRASYDQNGRPAVSFRFDPAGARAFGDFTAAHIGEPFAIVLDGQVISAPVIQSHIGGGSGIITGSFTTEGASELATLLRAGALPAELHVLEESTVGPELGRDSIEAGTRAAIAGLGLVSAMMLASYGGLGLAACLALGLNIAMLVGVLSVIGATLTLPGLAGIVLTMGMAVDANVLIFERTREELRVRKSVWQAVQAGYGNASTAILDSNLTGLLTAGLMFWLGAGPVRGFAVTLGLGILTSMFTAIFVTKTVLETWLEWRQPRKLALRGLLSLMPVKTAIDFFRWQNFTFGLSVAAVVLSVGVIAVQGLNLGTDFRGGTQIRAETTHVPDIAGYRAALEGAGLGDAVLAEISGPGGAPGSHAVAIRLGTGEGEDARALPTRAEAALKAVDPQIAFASAETVGGKVSAELLRMALWAVAAAMLGIVAYVWARFEWQFALGAVAALVHDVVVTLGVFALFGLKVDLTIVAALLTILGYSINDTVVVFDRLRENLRKYRKTPLRDLLNLSANETLARTLMTSGTTLAALLSLLFLGGDVIRGFALSITIGVVLGTWSSLYVAKNIVLYLGVSHAGPAGRDSAPDAAAARA
nr:protein translocase subunit SecD [Poseidonocella sp. HB161398]